VEGENEAGSGAVFKEVAFHKMRAGRCPGPTISVARFPTGESTHFRCCIHGAHLLSIEYVPQNDNTPVHLPALRMATTTAPDSPGIAVALTPIIHTLHVVTVRRATDQDGPLLVDALVMAFNWRPSAPTFSATEILAIPEMSHYVADWPFEGDQGFVAEDGPAVGAVWWRFFPSHDPGYGFVNDHTPEISIGVAPPYRGRGVGTLLLDALITEARIRSVPALSLSVDPDNPALRLHRRFGFEVVGASGSSVTMILDLGAHSAGTGGTDVRPH
jgi:ribosomal protein S18 acetylase RimI-like enzyme